MDYNVGDEVYFQAYEDNTPVVGKINRIGTLKELGKHQLDENDTRIFYELLTIGDDPTVFTVTTGKWIYKKNKFTAKDIVTKMAEIEARDPLTVQQILKIDMLDYKNKVREQAIHELSGKPCSNPIFN